MATKKWTTGSVLSPGQRDEVRAIAEEVFASKVAAALADPDVKGKSALGYLLGKVRRR